jgi:hypothetical protein
MEAGGLRIESAWGIEMRMCGQFCECLSRKCFDSGGNYDLKSTLDKRSCDSTSGLDWMKPQKHYQSF